MGGIAMSFGQDLQQCNITHGFEYEIENCHHQDKFIDFAEVSLGRKLLFLAVVYAFGTWFINNYVLDDDYPASYPGKRNHHCHEWVDWKWLTQIDSQKILIYGFWAINIV